MAITPKHIELFKRVREMTPPHYTHFYGMESLFREIAGVPSWLPLDVHLDHGLIIDQTKPDQYLAKTKAPLVFVDTAVRKRMVPNKANVHVLGSLFMRFRRKNKIEYNPLAAGTIVFPSHSSHHLSIEVSWSDYAKQLKALPAEYQPVTVCMYWIDILKGDHLHFEKEGLDVITNGHMFDPQYAYNFYNNLCQFKYASGNEPGSFLFYAVEMGMPFFLFGPSVYLINDGFDKTSSTRLAFNDLEYAARVKEAFAHNFEKSPVITKVQADVASVFTDDTEWIELDRLQKLIYANSLVSCKRRIGKKIYSIIKYSKSRFDQIDKV